MLATTQTTAKAAEKFVVPQPPEFTIGFKTKTKCRSLFTVTSTEDAAAVVRKCFDAENIEWVESFVVVALNKANKVLGFYRVSTGGVTGTVADPRVILQFAILSNACALLLCHNHPSGNLRPSQADEDLTEKITMACKYMDIKILDHLIITGDEGYYSFADDGNSLMVGYNRR